MIHPRAADARRNSWRLRRSCQSTKPAAGAGGPAHVPPALSDPAGYATIQGSKVAGTWPVPDQYPTIVGIDGSVPRGAA
jgi:hypothetical protein